ncbi:MAG: tetratricopeptide repeat protein [Pyrinomonadaceae bacterium]
MHLETSVLRPIEDPTITSDESALLRCHLAKKLQEASDYEAAREALGELWQGVGVRPNLDGLKEATKAEVLLRSGVLSGWLGSASQIEGAQERAKDLISESARLFEALGDTERAAEARIDLSTCYWREGAFDEARVTLREVLVQLEHSQGELKLRALLNSASVETACARYQDALRIHLQAAPLFETSDNNTLKGKFHNEFAVVFKNLGVAEHREDYIDRALMEYTAAGYHWEQAGDTRFCAAVENNIGSLLLSIGKVKDAHRHLNRARQLFVTLRDKVHIAQVDETRARACMAEGRNAEAEKLARSSVRTLEAGGEQSLLAEALTTQAAALSRSGRHQQAADIFRRAFEVAESAGHPEGAGQAALSMVEELGESLSSEIIGDTYARAEELLSRSQNGILLSRLGQCARRAFAVSRQPAATGENAVSLKPFEGCSLDEEVLRFEADLIKNALEAANGSVTRAARLLKVTHQGLAFILQGRHKHLLSARTPIRKRRRGIMRAH